MPSGIDERCYDLVDLRTHRQRIAATCGFRVLRYDTGVIAIGLLFTLVREAGKSKCFPHHRHTAWKWRVIINRRS